MKEANKTPAVMKKDLPDELYPGMPIEETPAGIGSEAPPTEKEKEQAARLRREMEESARAAREYKTKLEEEREKARQSARREAQSIIDEARAAADTVYDELNDIRKQKNKLENWQAVNDRRAEGRRLLNEAERGLYGNGMPEEPEPESTRPAREGDTVELELTKAEVVRGRFVRIGPGCEIARVEYTGDLTVEGGAVQEQVKV